MNVEHLDNLLIVVATIIIGFVGFWYQWKVAMMTDKSWRWIKQGLALVCLMWSIFYISVLFEIFGYHSIFTNLPLTHTWIIFPMNTTTLALIAASGMARKKLYEHK